MVFFFILFVLFYFTNKYNVNMFFLHKKVTKKNYAVENNEKFRRFLTK